MYKDLTVIGLTGGIASGKTTVARLMREQGIPVIDADGLGHLVLDEDGAAYESVINEFGISILAKDQKTIDRQALGKIVFDNPQKRAILEKLTHPAIAALAAQAMELVHQQGVPFAIYEAALLVETGIYKSLDRLIVIACSLENQLVRLCHRNGISKEAAAVRIASQLPLEDKIKVADYVVKNETDIPTLEQATEGLIATLKKQFPGSKN